MMKLFASSILLSLAVITASANTLFITGQTENVDDGGQFSAYLNSLSNPLSVYCVDFQNYESPDSAVNVSTPLNAADIADTRYGTTPASGFSFFSSGPGALTALDRYVEAAWLTTQYNFTSGVTASDDQIQNAIWTLLDTDGTSGFPNRDALGTGTYLVQADIWQITSALNGTLSAFESDVRIYTSASVAGDNNLGQGTDSRYSIGSQEMIGVVSSVPEPSAMWMAVAGLGLIMTARKNLRR